ncbi:MAG: mechanosensitive ion channel [Elusimicrobiota bacterium]|nr:mechanosensitive ion channel [Elusimicrobiota bacterium]
MRRLRELFDGLVSAPADGPARPLLTGALQAALAAAVFYAAWKLLDHLEDRLRARLEDPTTRLPALRLQHIELLPAERVRSGLVSALAAAQTAAGLLLAYAFAAFALSRFRATEALSEELLDYALAPLAAFFSGLVRFLPDLIFIVVTLVIARWALRLQALVFAEIGAGRLRLPGFHSDWAETTWQLARVMTCAFTAVVIFPYLPGSDSAAFKGVTVFLGVLLSLGSGSAIANAISGAVMTYMRPFAVGDRVEAGGTTGDVLERALLYTRLRTIKNEEVTVPNSVVLGGRIVNYSAALGHGGLILHTAVTIGYDAPWRKVQRLLKEAAAATDGVLAEPAPFVLQTALGDYSVRYELNAYTRRPLEMVQLYSRLHQNIQDRFNAEGVEIMSPAFFVRREKPLSTVPADPLGA